LVAVGADAGAAEGRPRAPREARAARVRRPRRATGARAGTASGAGRAAGAQVVVRGVRDRVGAPFAVPARRRVDPPAVLTLEGDDAALAQVILIARQLPGASQIVSRVRWTTGGAADSREHSSLEGELDGARIARGLKAVLVRGERAAQGVRTFVD